jgi:8-oxo-dGTP diphosphatase
MVTYAHPRPSVTVDIVLLQKSHSGPQVLLIERAKDPFQGRYALPGGFVDLEETLRAAAERELKEETGLTAPTLQQIYTFGDPDRDPRGRVISIAYGGYLPPDSAQVPRPASDARKTAWHPVDDLPPLAFDHHRIIQKALDVLGSSAP